MANWYPIPGFSAYETTSDGTVRTTDGTLQNCYASDNGYTPERGKFHVEWYLMNQDGGKGRMAVHKEDILKLVFNNDNY